MARGILIAACLAGLIGSGPAMAQDGTGKQSDGLETAIARCDALAAAPFDMLAAAPGVSMELVDAAAAIEACIVAVERAPEEPRLHFQLARARHLEGSYEAAAEGYRRALALTAYPAAENNLAALYRDGLGVAYSAAEALRLFEASAAAGFAADQYNLGDEYEDGELVKADLGEAVRYYMLAADQGYAPAQYRLGVMHFDGVGVAADIERAHDLILAAYEGGYADAAYSLGYLYEFGIVVEADLDRAVALYREAAARGVPNAVRALEELEVDR
ncbi:MAG: tetratricopeptide repeat protein [Azospirillaceae bacterium]